MTFKTFYTIMRTHDESIDSVEKFETTDDFLRVWYYPDVQIITRKIIRLDPTVIHIPLDHVREIEEHEHRW